MTTQAYGTTYHYPAPDGKRREIGVIRGLGDTWIVGYCSGLSHIRIKTPRLPAGSDPAALQALLDTWAAERGLPVATPDAAAPAPAAAERQQSEALPSIPSLTALPAVPDGWEAKAALVDQCVAAGQRLTLWIAVVVAQAREDFAHPGEWIAACTERWGWEKAHVHHMHAVGTLLIRECGSATLMSLHVDKLLAISRLPANLVAPFLERARPQDRTRDEVRAAVNRWLAAAGEPPADDAPASPEPAPRRGLAPAVQQDFFDALFAAADEPATDFQTRVTARAASVSGVEAFPLLNRAWVVLHAMIPRLDASRPEVFPVLAKTLREEADRVERMAAGITPRQLAPSRE